MTASRESARRIQGKTCLVVQWLRFHSSNAGGMGSIPGRGAKIPLVMWPKRKILKSDSRPAFLESCGVLYTRELKGTD